MLKSLTPLTVVLVVVGLMLALAGCPQKQAPQQAAAPTVTPATPGEPTQPAEPEPVDEAGDYNMGDLPEATNEHLIRAVVPPEGSAPETDQWPACVWAAVGEAKLVVYAKHETGFDPETQKGKLVVWVGPPQQYIDEIAEDHEYGPADAAAYLNAAGIECVKADVYIGPGDKVGDPDGYEPWTSANDRCTVATIEPGKHKTEFPRLRVWAETPDGEQYIYRGTITCYCPQYPEEEPEDPWIYVTVGKEDKYVVDQWGLPANTPVPGDS